MSRIFAATMLAGVLAWTSIAEARTIEPATVILIGSKKTFTDNNGRSLYTFDKDQPGKSECTLLCAVAWPPFLAASGAKPSGSWNLIQRSNGTMQWAYKGSPLYTYAFDRAPGDVSGDGVEGVWHIARP